MNARTPASIALVALVLSGCAGTAVPRTPAAPPVRTATRVATASTAANPITPPATTRPQPTIVGVWRGGPCVIGRHDVRAVELRFHENGRYRGVLDVADADRVRHYANRGAYAAGPGFLVIDYDDQREHRFRFTLDGGALVLDDGTATVRLARDRPR